MTFAEYDAFTQATNRARADDRGWGRGSRPVINVNWDDATAYANWLSDKTGQVNRLSVVERIGVGICRTCTVMCGRGHRTA